MTRQDAFRPGSRADFVELHDPPTLFPDCPLHDGVDGDCLAQASLFTALSELVSTYGEDAVAKFAEGVPARVRNGEFSLKLAKQ